MRRRTFALGVLASLAGCLGARSPEREGATPTTGPTRTTDDTPTDTAGTAPSADVTVESVRLQYGVVTPTSPDSIGVEYAETPYLVVSVRVDGALSRDEFGLRTGDVSHSPTRIDRLYRTAWGEDRWYERGRSDGLVLFETPPEPTTDLRVTWPGGDQPVDDGAVARIQAGPPRLTASLDVPDTHDGATAPPVAIEVTNEGATAGRFLGALNRVGPRVAYTPVARVSELVPAGETVTVSVTDSWSGTPPEERLGDGESDVTYHLDFAGGEGSAGIRLVEAS